MRAKLKSILNKMKISYGKNIYGKEEIRAVTRKLNKTTQMGKAVNTFEKEISKYFNKKYGLMVNSGSSALMLANDVLNFKKGDEIITPCLNFGTAEEVETQLEKLSNMAKTGDRVYWRQNTFGNDHPWHEDSENVRFFAWSKDKNEYYCRKYNFTLKDIQHDAQNRLYAEWIKND